MCRPEPAATGRWGRVVWAVETGGKRAALDFFKALSDQDAAKMQALFNRLAEFGRIKTPEHFKKVEDRNGVAIWEFKKFQMRFLGGFGSGRQFVVALGLRKKVLAQRKLRSRDIDRAARILKEHQRAQVHEGERHDAGGTRGKPR